jgi:spore germination protein GerM
VNDALDRLKRALALAGRGMLVLVVLLVVGAVATVVYFRSRAAHENAALEPAAVPPGTRAIELYFPSARGGELVLETREVVEEASEPATQVRTVVDEFLRGPETKEAHSAFPDGVTLKHVYRDPSGGLYLDFSNDLRSDFRGGSTAETQLVGSLLTTLATNVPDVHRVTLTAGGQPIHTLGGHLRLDAPLLVSEWR